MADTKQDLGVDVIDGIESLVNKSLLQLSEHPDGETRLTMMETVREYALERLVESGEDGAVRKSHAAYFLVLAEEAANELEGIDQAMWIDRLDRDRDNGRAALDWLIRVRQCRVGLAPGDGNAAVLGDPRTVLRGPSTPVRRAGAARGGRAITAARAKAAVRGGGAGVRAARLQTGLDLPERVDAKSTASSATGRARPSCSTRAG